VYWAFRVDSLSHFEYVRVRRSGGRLLKISVAMY
jgi:hypothetical protein